MEAKASAGRVVNSRQQIIGITALLVIVLGGFLLWASWPLLMGTEIVLDTQPFDPFDPLRGQYMTIRYEVSMVPALAVNAGETVYVKLREDDAGVWRYESVSLQKPEGVFLKGTVDAVSGDTMRLNYGIEQFFFEKGADVPTRDVTVKAKVSSGGTARIVGLLQDGEPVRIEYRAVSLSS